MIDLHFCHPSKAPPDIPRLHIQAYPPPFVVQLTAGRHIPELQPQGEERDLMLRLVAARKAGHPSESLHFAAYELSYKMRAFQLADRCRGWLESLQDDQQSPITGPESSSLLDVPDPDRLPAALVARALELCRAVGKSPATADEARGGSDGTTTRAWRALCEAGIVVAGGKRRATEAGRKLICS